MKHAPGYASDYPNLAVTRYGQVDVYPVGVLADLRHAYGMVRIGRRREAVAKLRYTSKRIAGWARAGNWRAVRSSFNGHLAEPLFPGPWKRAGTGWTRRRALRDLERHLAEVGR